MKRFFSWKQGPLVPSLVIAIAGTNGIFLTLIAAYSYFIGLSDFVNAPTQARMWFVASITLLQIVVLPAVIFLAFSTLPKALLNTVIIDPRKPMQ
ncbi:MAG: hypothetical protein AB7T07_15230 [Steroidobacteraceae bacterium]